jgi:isocitrate dehydrogenase
MSKKHAIAVAKGDGIGPEIMDAALSILKAAQAPLEPHFITIGEKVYLEGALTGITEESWDIIKKTKAFFKAPITTPQGGGFKSLNVTIRAALGLYANVRPCSSFAPYIQTKHPVMDVVIIRENEEDLYAGIEYQESFDTTIALKVITREGSRRIIRYAFEYALKHGRKKVTCFSKDNILKITDGLFHTLFDEIGREYPEIEKEHWIIDIGAAKLADTPELFDVIVMANLYGDILSDVSAQIAGSVGLAGSANIGLKHAMFEAIHGSAPRRAHQNLANPSGLILASVHMLLYLDEPLYAQCIHNAFLKTIEEGIHTYDIFREGVSTKRVGTQEFAEAVVKNLGEKPHTLKAVNYKKKETEANTVIELKNSVLKKLVGVDVFIDWKLSKQSLIQVAKELKSPFELFFIANRGALVYPDGHEETNLSDIYRLRFLKEEAHEMAVTDLLKQLIEKNLLFVQCQNLYTFNGEKMYSLSHLEK